MTTTIETIRVMLGSSAIRHKATSYVVEERNAPYLLDVITATQTPSALHYAPSPDARCGKAYPDEEAGVVIIPCYVDNVRVEDTRAPILGKIIADIGAGYTDNVTRTLLEAWETRNA